MNVITRWTLLPYERYYPMNVITWWTYLMNVITWWTYLMNVIPETILVYYINISTFFNNGDALINQKVTDYIFLSTMVLFWILIKGSNKHQCYVFMNLIKGSNKLQCYVFMNLIKGSNKHQCYVFINLIKGSNKHQCYVFINLIRLFWYLIHIERIVRNVNSTRVDVIKDIIENDTTLVYALFGKCC